MKHEDKMDLERAIELASKPEHISMIRKIGISAMMLIGLGAGFKGPDYVGTLKKEVKPITQQSSYKDHAYNHFAHIIQKTSDGNAWAGDDESKLYHGAGIGYWSRGKYEKAIDYFKKAIAEKEDPASYGMIAQCILDMNGNPNEAIKWANEAIKRTNSEAYIAKDDEILARAYARLGQCDLAIKHAKKSEKAHKKLNIFSEGDKNNLEEVYSHCKK